MPDPDPGAETSSDPANADEMPEPVSRFVEKAESIFHEYDEGYLDPDSALSRLGDDIAELRDAYEEE